MNNIQHMLNLNSKADNNIIIVYASTGSGHKTAAKAIFNSFNKYIVKNAMNNIHLHFIDILDFFMCKIDGNSTVKFTNGIFSSAFDFAWHKNFCGKILWGGGNLWPSFLYKKFESYIKECEPCAFICTHFVGANAAVKARISMKEKFPIISVPTDYETEGLWPHLETDLFCVGCTKMAETLLGRKVSAKKIAVTGIPTDEAYSAYYDKKNVLKKYSLPDNKKIILIIAGAEEPGPYIHLRNTLDNSIKYFAKMDWCHFVFCVGNDKNYFAEVISKCRIFTAENISVYPYINDLPELMHSADIVISKPGGLIVTECICAKLPLVLAGKAYAQERANKEFLCNIGAAISAMNYEEIIDALCKITSEKDVYNKLMAAVNKIRRPKAADDIVDLCFNLIINYKNCTPNRIYKPGIYLR